MDNTISVEQLEAQLLAHYKDVQLDQYVSYRGQEDCGFCLKQNGKRIGGVSAGRKELKILFDVVQLIEARQTLQIGVAFGLSTHALAIASQVNQITAMDNYTELDADGFVQEIARQTLSIHSNVDLQVASSPANTAHCLHHLAPNEKLSLAFIDGMHTDEAATADYDGFASFLNPKSVVLWHDIDKVNHAFHDCFDENLFDLKLSLSTWGHMGVYINSAYHSDAITYLKSFTIAHDT